MVLSPKLSLAQRQALVMTPQLQQAIKLLQLNQIELAAFVEEELERNPLLMQDEEGGESPTPAEAAGEPAPTDFGEDESFDPRAEGDGGGLPEDEVGTFDAFDPGQATGPLSGGGPAGDDDTDYIQRLGQGQTLRDHLLPQVGMEFEDPRERMIAAALVDMLDGDGYLRGDLGALADQLGVEPEALEAIVRRLQQLDPPGVFARSLAECLALQLADRDRLDPAMQALLDNLDLVARRDYPALMKRCRVDGEDLADMVAELRRLDPRPGSRFDTETAQTLVPDIFLRRAPDGGWLIELNTDMLPRVLINRGYHATLARGARDRREREFITERLQSANWLVKALDQRANTILRVAREIVRQQEGFFRKGVAGLRPLVLRDIAEAVELHESTVSRVTANKYMATPRGTFELKFFFTTGLSAGSGGTAVTAEAVRERIRTMIEGEPPGAPLSDDRIVELLGQEGIVIARRTVAKYRDALRIPSSAQRRRDKSLGLLRGTQK